MEGVTFTTKDVGSMSSRCEVYSIQSYLIKFLIDLWQVL